MRLAYKPLKCGYTLSGTITDEEDNHIVRSGETIVVEPLNSPLFTNYQKLRFVCRFDLEDEDDSFKNFLRDTADMLNGFVLELTPRGEPHYLANHEALKKKWISGQAVLRSEYAGEWASKELELMTNIFNDEKKLRTALLQDFILHELYNRNIFKIVLDKETHKAVQTGRETALDCMPLVFEQEYQREDTPKGDRLIVEGKAPPLQENRAQAVRLCRGKTFTPQDITEITQRTVYGATDLLNIPEKIETIFRINGKDGCLKKTKIVIETKKM